MNVLPIRDLVGAEPLTFQDDCEPLVAVPTATEDRSPFDGAITIDSVHDGWIIPRRFVAGLDEDELAEIDRIHVRERDWGAHWIARELAARLGVARCQRVTVARALLDFNRFPGSTPPGVDFINRLAINEPFSSRLSHALKFDLMANYYDRISHAMDGAVDGRLLKVGIHTYDTNNPAGTERPAVSLITRSLSYQLQATLPLGGFDAMFPQVLGEFMSDRVLSYRIALALEKRRIPVIMNFPYLLPDGGVEVRSQVWLFFRYLRRRFEEIHTYRDEDEHAAFSLVWTMLMDTNSRSTASAAFREYIHAFGHAPRGLEDFFERGREAYETVQAFLHANHDELVNRYRYSKRRPSSLAIELRKDYLWVVDDEGRPTHLKVDEAERAVEGIAAGIDLYLREDIGVEELSNVM
jgi:hypothetical protein